MCEYRPSSLIGGNIVACLVNERVRLCLQNVDVCHTRGSLESYAGLKGGGEGRGGRVIHRGTDG